MPQTQRQKIGDKGEKLAVKFLKKKGCKILERNYRADKYGELDIIAKDKSELVFVEVKTKTDEQFGLPEEELTYQKKQRMHRAIQNYLFKKYLTNKEWRADLIAVEIKNGRTEVRHYENIGL